MSKGVLLVNLGSPDSPSVPDVRRYLNEFLMDGRVIDEPWLMRRFVVGMILINRPKETAHAYQKVWTKDGSPLIAISKNVVKKLQPRVKLPIELAMRYQNPSIPDAMRKLAGQGIDDLLLIPLFPQYAMSSFETAVERVREVAFKIAPKMRITVQLPFYKEPDYIAALVMSAEEYLSKGYDYILFSYHGLPERQIKKSDPTGCHCLAKENCCEVASPAHATCYRAQCFQTTAAFVQNTGVPAGKYSVSFQSRLGKDPWLKPYTDLELERLAKQGVKKLLVMCPAFVSDCLETIEEIGMRGRDTFLQAGGKEFAQIPCLNEHPLWIDALEGMIAKFGNKK
ncbi:MAG TPA: ferrochelatase [Candidatus Polarisedimenticolia bacterium]|nr:ferrochelatase [Candidatus Polarisedimenticolia bacterium]